MLTLAVLSGPWPRIGIVVAALLAAGAILARSDVQRAWSMLGAMVLAPALLLDDVWGSSALSIVHRHPLEAAIGAAVALAILAVAAYLIHLRPAAVPLLAVLTLPFRIPIAVDGTTASGGSSANLLLPLYFVIAASALAWIVPTLWTYHHTGAQSEQRPGRQWFERILAAYVVAYALQALYASSSINVLQSPGVVVPFVKALQNEVFFYVPFAVLLALLRDFRWTRETLVRCLQISVGLAVIFAFMGFGEELTKTLWLNSNLIASNQLHQYFEVNTVFFDPDIFGRYLALVMILLVAVLLYDKRTRSQLAAVVALAILWACLIFTLSRSSLLALLVGMTVLAALRWRPRPVLYAAAVVILAGAVTIAVHPSSFGYSLSGASSDRSNLVTNGIRLFGERPLQGWGSGSFSTEYTLKFPQSARKVSDSHNIPVTIASEQGLIGLLLYVALVICAIVTLLRGARGDPYRIAIFATFLGLLLHTMLYADFLEDPTTWALLGVGGALAAASDAWTSAGDHDPADVPRLHAGV